MIDDLNDFIIIFCKCISLYYNFSKFSEEMQLLLSIENLSNFIICLFFENEEIYNFIYESQKKIDLKFEEKINSNFEKVKFNLFYL